MYKCVNNYIIVLLTKQPLGHLKYWKQLISDFKLMENYHVQVNTTILI